MNKNSQTALNIVAVIVGMFGLAYASVPLYNLFCRVTGFGGQTVIAENVPSKIYDRGITVLFDSNVNPELPWEFKPLQNKVTVKIGESGLALYEAQNKAATPITGTAIYNVTPYKAAKYFNKVECFCFEQQTLAPGEKIQFPVSFFVDPEIINDKNLSEVATVTLSYTFFEYKGNDNGKRK